MFRLDEVVVACSRDDARVGKRRMLVCAVGGVLLLTSCGSTVQLGSSRIDGQRSADGLGFGELARPDPANGAPASAPPGAPGSESHAPLRASEARSSPLARLAGERSAKDGPGVTASSIKIGIPYTTDAGAGNSALGAGSTDPGDNRVYYGALIDEVNKSGGIAGRQLVPSYIEFKATSSDSVATQTQAACEWWTRDDPVFAVLGINSEDSRRCAESRNLLSLNTGASNSIASTYARYPHLLEISSMGLDRNLVATVDGLAGSDYYGSAPIVGIIAWDDPNYRTAVQRNMLPALGRRGYRAQPPVYITVPQDMNSIGGASASVSSAVLNFRQHGVTHVFIADGPAGIFAGTGLTLLFIKNAASQQYFPRYGMNDSNSPQFGLDSGLWSAEDVRGSRVVSYANSLDSSDVGVKPNVARRTCLDIMSRHGVRPANANQRGAILKACDYISMLRDALGTARVAVNRDTFMAGAASVGTKHRSPLVYRTRFNSSQRDGASGLRRQRLDEECGCYRYTSAVYEAPRR